MTDSSKLTGGIFLLMPFAFEKLDVYRKAIDFGTTVIDIVEGMNAPRNHSRLIEQLEAAATSVAMNTAEGKGRYSKKNSDISYTLQEDHCMKPLCCLGSC